MAASTLIKSQWSKRTVLYYFPNLSTLVIWQLAKCQHWLCKLCSIFKFHCFQWCKLVPARDQIFDDVSIVRYSPVPGGSESLASIWDVLFVSLILTSSHLEKWHFLALAFVTIFLLILLLWSDCTSFMCMLQVLSFVFRWKCKRATTRGHTRLFRCRSLWLTGSS